MWRILIFKPSWFNYVFHILLIDVHLYVVNDMTRAVVCMLFCQIMISENAISVSFQPIFFKFSEIEEDTDRECPHFIKVFEKIIPL